MIKRLANAWRRACLKWRGANIGRWTHIAECRLIGGDASGVSCGEGCYFADGARISIGPHEGKSGRLRVGARLFMNHYAVLDCHFDITIGDDVLIGPHCYIGDFDHSISDGTKSIRVLDGGKAAPVRIGSSVWLGANVTVLKGVTLGDGAVVGAGSVVTRDVPAGAIVVGNPVRVLRMRDDGEFAKGGA